MFFRAPRATRARENSTAIKWRRAAQDEAPFTANPKCARRCACASIALAGGISAFVACGSSNDTQANDAGDDASIDVSLDQSATSTDASRDGASTLDANACSADAAAPWSDPGIAPPAPDPALAGKTHHYFKISVVDKNGNTPIAGVVLKTTNKALDTSDTNGLIAYYEPGLMDTDVYFSPSRAGYTFPADGLNNVGVALHTSEGGGGVIALTKTADMVAPTVGDLDTRLLAGPVPGAAQCFSLRFTDSVTTRGVPLVAATTDGGNAYWSDSQGMIAYCDPDHVGKAVTFTITSDGYELAPNAPLAIATKGGGSVVIPIVRKNVAERLYRITGQGIYRDSVLLGLTAPVAKPNINGLVMGQDTPSTNVYGGKLYWIWQDTDRPAYPLGNFDSSGATTALPDAGGLSPDLGMNATYFVNADGFSRGMVNTSESGGPIWLGQLVNVVDPQGKTKMYGRYYVARTSNPSSALAVFDDATSTFDFVADYPANAIEPAGRPTLVSKNGVTYAYWNNPVRFPATVAGITAFTAYEVFSAYGANGGTTLATNADGTLAYDWRSGATPVTPDALKAANIGSDQALDGHLTDIEAGGNVAVANESLIWDDYRKRFAKVIQQKFGSTSALGEMWFAEADTPLGPWVYTRKIATHAGYTFYNPDLIPYFNEAGGRIVFFDATYTSTYTNITPTPRYDYNEIMYRLDLDDTRVVLPVAVYEKAIGTATSLVTKRKLRANDPARAAAFFAYDRPAPGAIPIAWNGASCGARSLVSGQSPTPPIFYALPADAKDDAGASPTVPLYVYDGPNGAKAYSVDPALARTGFTRGGVLARVWPSPIRVSLPVADFLGDLVADAGADQCVAASANGGATVALDASASRDDAGSITHYTWTLLSTGCVIANGINATAILPAGLDAVRLDVTDDAGNTSSDTLVVQVGNP